MCRVLSRALQQDILHTGCAGQQWLMHGRVHKAGYQPGAGPSHTALAERRKGRKLWGANGYVFIPTPSARNAEPPCARSRRTFTRWLMLTWTSSASGPASREERQQASKAASILHAAADSIYCMQQEAQMQGREHKAHPGPPPPCGLFLGPRPLPTPLLSPALPAKS